MLINNYDVKSCYIFTPLNLDSKLDKYKKLVIGDYNLYYSYDSKIKIFTLHNAEVCLIGYLFDIRNSSLSESDIISNLIESDDIYNELDHLNGRFNIIYRHESTYKLYTDASQLRPLVYHTDSKSLASHDEVLKIMLENYNYQFTKRPLSNHNEFDLTRYSNIYKYNPSLELDLINFTFKRIYPRNNLKSKDATESFKELRPYLDESIKYLNSIDNKIILSITAGIDSRVSAALTRTLKNKVEYLTYTKPLEKLHTKTQERIYRIDEKITRDLKENLGWNHEIINLGDYSVSNEEMNYNHKFLNSRHSFSLASYYKNEKQYKDVFHIKSTVFGMGKADFPSTLDKVQENNEFYKQCVHGISSKFSDKHDVDYETNNYFIRNLVSDNVTKGRHYFDLFHLESRMGNWHSMLTLETDPETEEFIFTNCRKIIDIIQQPSINERRDFQLYKLIINHYWPILLFFGVNKIGNKNLLDYNHQTVKTENSQTQLKPLKIINRNNMTIQVSGKEKIEVKPCTNTIFSSELYGFDIVNTAELTTNLILESNYENENNRDRIKVMIRHNGMFEIYDILDLKKGLNMKINKNTISIDIFYDKNYIRQSWKAAGNISVYLK